MNKQTALQNLCFILKDCMKMSLPTVSGPNCIEILAFVSG